MTRGPELDAEAILAQARLFLERPTSHRARVLAQVEARLGGAARAGAPGAAAGEEGPARELVAGAPAQRAFAGVGRSGARLSWGKLVSVGLLTGFGGFWLGRYTSGEHELPPARAAATVVPAAAEEAAGPARATKGSEGGAASGVSEPLASAPALAPRAPAPTHPAKQKSSRLLRGEAATAPAAAEPSFDLQEALAQVRRAKAAREQGRAGDALMFLSELDQRAPAELLLEERLITRVLAECDLGNVAEARRSAEQLAQHNRDSIYARRLQASCAGLSGEAGKLMP